MFMQTVDPQAAGSFGPDGILKTVCQHIDRHDRRLTNHLLATARVLDSLGWCVALRLLKQPPFVSRNARPLFPETGIPATWDEIATCLAAVPPARFLLSADTIRIWSAEPELGPSIPDPPRLTKRETEIFGWLSEGKTGPEVAIILGCSQRTVESHVARFYRKIGIHNRTQLIFRESK
ncbi:MAG: helix-turn-helix transcriptional regulator [Verrucomicrobiota bacterium]